jgi:hypothetical protein
MKNEMKNEMTLNDLYFFLLVFYVSLVWKIWDKNRECTIATIIVPAFFMIPFGILFGIIYLLGFQLNPSYIMR